MNISYNANPFREVTRKGTLTSSFKQKLDVAMRALVGPTDFEYEYIFGILDYATLFIVPLLLLATEKLSNLSNNEKTPKPIQHAAYGLAAVLYYLAVGLKFVQLGISLILTVATSWITAIVHGISLLVKNSLEAKQKSTSTSKNEAQPNTTKTVITRTNSLNSPRPTNESKSASTQVPPTSHQTFDEDEYAFDYSSAPTNDNTSSAEDEKSMPRLNR